MNSNIYNKLTDDVINQIKDFNRHKLSKKQKSLIVELIPNEELRERYKEYGLCDECNQPILVTVNTMIIHGANLVTPSIFNRILTNGPVAIKKLTSLYKIFNQMQLIEKRY